MNSFEQKEPVDTLITNAEIYTVNAAFDKAEAMAVRGDRIVDIGASAELTSRYLPHTVVDLKGKSLFPGFIDAHAHFTEFALAQNRVDLTGTQSYEEVLQRLQKHMEEHRPEALIGFGWDQNDWPERVFPDKGKLDEHFPNIPVLLHRIDVHAALVNSEVLRRAGISASFKVEGGEVVLDDQGLPTGILIDSAKLPAEALELDKADQKKFGELVEIAQEKCFAVGLTGVSDMGFRIDPTLVDWFDQLYASGQLKISNYMMPDVGNSEWRTLIFNPKNGEVVKPIKALKVFMDGALGSYGARLLQPYSDNPESIGVALTEKNSLREYALIAYENNLQLCVHAIGDAANRDVLQVFAEVLSEGNNRRWRVEHAQVIHPDDFNLFGKYNILPSVQPTHATSDMNWVVNRLGKERLRSSYALKQLLDQNGWMPLGSDFPIESINPLLGFYAAVARRDLEGNPKEGFQMENALSREEALRGMTIWNAKAQFEEDLKGSLEIGKVADFVVLDRDIMRVPLPEIPKTKVLSTWIKGEEVYKYK